MTLNPLLLKLDEWQGIFLGLRRVFLRFTFALNSLLKHAREGYQHYKSDRKICVDCLL